MYTENIAHVLPLYHIPGLLLKVQTTEKTWNPKTGKENGTSVRTTHLKYKIYLMFNDFRFQTYWQKLLHIKLEIIYW